MRSKIVASATCKWLEAENDAWRDKVLQKARLRRHTAEESISLWLPHHDQVSADGAGAVVLPPGWRRSRNEAAYRSTPHDIS